MARFILTVSTYALALLYSIYNFNVGTAGDI